VDGFYSFYHLLSLSTLFLEREAFFSLLPSLSSPTRRVVAGGISGAVADEQTWRRRRTGVKNRSFF
jgi:hypothetical protein